MAFHWFKGGRQDLLDGNLRNAASPDVRFLLVMTNTTADTDKDAAVLTDIGTLDEYDGSGYSRAALASESWASDDANDRHELSATTPVSFGTTVAAGTRSAQGIVAYRHIGADSSNIPLWYTDDGGFPVNGSGGEFKVNMNAEGFAQIKTGT